MSPLWRLLSAGIGIAVCVTFFLVVFAKPFLAVQTSIARSGGAVWSSAVGLRDALKPEYAALQKENIALRAERDALVRQVAQLRDAKEENDQLQGLLRFQKREGGTMIPAHILGGSTFADVQEVTIDVGSSSGVQVGDVTIVSDGFVVGKIVRVTTNRSVVQLMTDAQSRFAGALFSQKENTTVSGVIEGGHGAALVMRLIPQSVAVGAGDIVVTAGLESGIPRGFVLGTIESVVPENNLPFQVATIQPSAPLDRLLTVGVVLAPR